jgi:hypothetical protein
VARPSKWEKRFDSDDAQTDNARPDQQLGVGGAKADQGKTKWYLLPWKVIEGVAQIMTFGANKYTEQGWKDVPQAKDRYFAALMRHWRYMDEGVYLDDESGLPHWAHFCCNAVFLGYFYMQESDK